MNTTATSAQRLPAASGIQATFVVAWAFCLLFYFMEYVVRSAPSVMLPELTKAFGLATVGLSSLIGLQKLAGGAALSLDVFVKADGVFVAAIVVAAILALFLKETGSAAQKAR